MAVNPEKKNKTQSILVHVGRCALVWTTGRSSVVMGAPERTPHRKDKSSINTCHESGNRAGRHLRRNSAASLLRGGKGVSVPFRGNPPKAERGILLTSARFRVRASACPQTRQLARLLPGRCIAPPDDRLRRTIQSSQPTPINVTAYWMP